MARKFLIGSKLEKKWRHATHMLHISSPATSRPPPDSNTPNKERFVKLPSPDLPSLPIIGVWDKVGGGEGFPTQQRRILSLSSHALLQVYPTFFEPLRLPKGFGSTDDVKSQDILREVREGLFQAFPWYLTPSTNHHKCVSKSVFNKNKKNIKEIVKIPSLFV